MANLAIFPKQEFYELPKGWKWARIGEIAKINKEQRNPSVETPNEEFIYIDISGVEGGTGRIREVKKILGKDAPSRARRVVHTNDIIISTVRPYLKSFALIPKEYDNQICSTGFAVLTCLDEIIPKYFLYALFSDIVMDQCNRMMTGAHYPALRKSQVSQIVIPLPPLEEQRRIVARIEQLLNKVEEARRLRKQAREEADQIMQVALHKVFSRAEEEGWRWIKLGKVCKINPPKAEIKDLPDNMEVTFVPMAAVNEITGRLENPKIRRLGEVKKGYTYFKEGDILFAKITPCMENGKCAIARNLVNGIGFGTTEFHIIRPTGSILAEWIHFYLRQSCVREEAKRHFTGSVGQQRVPKEFLDNLIISLPLLEEQRRIVAYLDKIKETVDSLKKFQQETEENLEKLVPTILDKAFRGEL